MMSTTHKVLVFLSTTQLSPVVQSTMNKNLLLEAISTSAELNQINENEQPVIAWLLV